jgi:hypothetical protein
MKITENNMKKILSIVTIVGCFSGVLSAANFGIGISGSDEGIDSFSLSIGNYYGVPVREVREVEYYVPREHMSVVYFLADRSHRDPHYIAELRQQGLSWWSISLRLGLDPYLLYRVDNSRNYGPPYGQSKNKHRRLHDSEIADIVNVRFISDYHHIRPDEVIDRRRKGEKYYHINEYYHKTQERPQYREERKIYKERKEERRERKEDRRDDRSSKGDKNKKENGERRNDNSRDR